MKYKISDEPMKLREFGRNVQMMLDYCKTLPDREERNALARTIVRIMAHINPSVTEEADYQQKLWDHLMLLADYDLDADIPAEFTRAEESRRFTRPKTRMEYRTHRSRFLQYGHNVELLAEQAYKMEDEEEKMALVALILNVMKMQIKGAEKDINAELIVCEHLKTLSKGRLDYQPEDVRFHKYARETMPQLANYSTATYQPRNGAKKKKKKVQPQKKYK
ncbi:MAG: DUF4290 domain-containing protein [Bacteroidetes bacterium]|jgi:hypothetical protein|nr:DUF4290 domain-containing protein [Bacteroidota bacterium]MBL0017052.1 DUF4290 domain-containing protein [Bacteroidota bacterium]